jgi:hypothetical protein
LEKKTENDKRLQELKNKENDLFKDIKTYKETIRNKLVELDKSIDNSSRLRIDSVKRLKSEIEAYTKLVDDTYKRVETGYLDNLNDLRQLYSNDIKSYNIDFSKPDINIDKLELLRNLNEMNVMRKNYKEKEIEYLKNLLLNEHQKILAQHDVIKSLSTEYQRVANDYKKLNLEKFDLLNQYNSLDKVENEYNDIKSNLLNEKINKTYQEVKIKIT